MVLTSKLIDGTFPDYQRVIPQGERQVLEVDNTAFAQAVDRVSTLSSDKGRAVKLTISDGKLTLSVNNPDSGSATEELPADYGSIRSISASTPAICSTFRGQFESGKAEFQLADAGSPTMVRDGRTRPRSTCSCRCGYEGDAQGPGGSSSGASRALGAGGSSSA